LREKGVGVDIAAAAAAAAAATTGVVAVAVESPDGVVMREGEMVVSAILGSREKLV